MRRGVQCRGPAHENDLCSAALRGIREGVAHFAAGAIAEIANRVESLARAARSDKHVSPARSWRRPTTWSTTSAMASGSAMRPAPDRAAGQVSGAGFDDADTALAQNIEICLGGGVLPHIHVHRGGDKNGRAWWRDKEWRGSRLRFRERIWRECWRWQELR